MGGQQWYAYNEMRNGTGLYGETPYQVMIKSSQMQKLKKQSKQMLNILMKENENQFWMWNLKLKTFELQTIKVKWRPAKPAACANVLQLENSHKCMWYIHILIHSDTDTHNKTSLKSWGTCVPYRLQKKRNNQY